MPGAATPPTLLEAIASLAGGAYITNPMPETPTGTEAASVQGGFPPMTMQNEFSGGEPPLGQDMNGFLFLISSHTLYVECGQLYQYNNNLATAIGGYLAGTILGMADGTGMWLNILNGNTSNPDTGGAGWVPMAAYGFANVTGLTGGIVALTAAQAKYPVIVLSGTLTSNLTVQFPKTEQQWLVINRTTGAFNTTLNTAAVGSTGVASPQGGYSAPLGVYSVGDGNIYPAVAPLSVPIDQNANPLTLAERTNTGQLLATYFFMTGAADNFPIDTVMYQKASDGNIRRITLGNFEAQLLLQNLGGAITNGQIPASAVTQFEALLWASAALTGSPTAPTQATGDSSTKIATTAFANPGVTINANGVAIKFPSGWIIQAGRKTVSGTTTVTYPIAFPTQVEAFVLSNISSTNQIYVNGSPGLASASVTNGNADIFWIAVGN